MAFVYTSVTSDRRSLARLLLSAINTATGAGFPDLHCTQLGQVRFKPFPNPAGDILAGRVFQARHLVQVMVVEHVVQRFERCLDVGEVHHDAAPYPPAAAKPYQPCPLAWVTPFATASSASYMLSPTPPSLNKMRRCSGIFSATMQWWSTTAICRSRRQCLRSTRELDHVPVICGQ